MGQAGCDRASDHQGDKNNHQLQHRRLHRAPRRKTDWAYPESRAWRMGTKNTGMGLLGLLRIRIAVMSWRMTGLNLGLVAGALVQ